MKFERTDSFKSDWQRLTSAERAMFRDAVRIFHSAAERSLASRSGWPAGLRVKAVANAPGIFEMTWSFSGPDGRATFEWTEIDGEPAVRWRRIGGHAVFKRP